MSALRSAGFFSDLPYGDPDAPRLADRRAAAPTPYEREAVGFLRGGGILLVSPGVSFDALDPTKAIGTLAIQTDGAWAWPADLAYYVERYHCALPPEFVEHMRDRGWIAGSDVDVSDLAPPAHLGLVPLGNTGLIS